MKVKQRTLANIKLRSRSFTVHEANKVLHLNTFNVSKEYGSFITKILSYIPKKKLSDHIALFYYFSLV